jgi:hypothetical protein
VIQVEKKVETEESKQWRKEEMLKFNERKAVFPAYALDSLIGELQSRAFTRRQVHTRDPKFQEDIDRLVELAFGKYGIEPENRVQDIPWTAEDKEAIVAQLQHIAVEYGELEPEVMDELAKLDESADAPEADSVAEQIKALEGRIRLQKILVEKSGPGENDYAKRKADLRALEEELEALKQEQQLPDGDGNDSEPPGKGE